VRGPVNLISDMLIFLVLVIVVSLAGGFVPALLAAIVGSLLLNYYFTPPIHLWTTAEGNNIFALAVFVVVAVLVSSVVDMAARRTRQAARANAESELLATTAGSVLRGQRAVEAVLTRIREAFGMDSVTLLECGAAPGGAPLRGPAAGWVAVAHSGEPALTKPDDADADVPVTETLWLALRGRSLTAADRRVLGAFAALRYSPPGQPPLLTASALDEHVELRVADRGPGVPEADRDAMFVPFQRLGDTDNTTGVGLGLALSRGLTEAMAGTLEPGDTPGGRADHGRVPAGGRRSRVG
jgi:K+-sensing histidine kinase KdpD